MKLDDHLRALVDAAAASGLLRSPSTYDGPVSHPQLAGRTHVSFASNDYLGLAAHPRLRESLSQAAAQLGGPASSRVVAGTSSAHRCAEAALAAHAGHADARVFSSAYAANVAVLGSLLGPPDLILSDELNHASIIDGCRLSRARVMVYRHADPDHLAWLLRQHAASARVTAVVTESVFSMDADVADVEVLRRLTDEHGAALVVDEAHAFGVVGARGEGVCGSRGIAADVVVGGLGKAFGLAGGFVAGSAALTRAIDNVARPFLFSTAMLPAVAATIPLATELLRGASTERARVLSHVAMIRDAAAGLGWRALGSPLAPIVPVVVGTPQAAVELSQALRARGFLVPVMRPPTVPVGTSRMRWSATAVHTEHEVRAACDAFGELAAQTLPADRQRDHQASAAQG